LILLKIQIFLPDNLHVLPNMHKLPLEKANMSFGNINFYFLERNTS